MRNLIIMLIATGLLSSCVSNQKFMDMQTSRDEAQQAYEKVIAELKSCDEQKMDCEKELSTTVSRLKNKEQEFIVKSTQLESERSKTQSLGQELEYFKSTNTNLLERLSDLSIVSKTGAESIQKSLEALNEQNRYIKDLTSSMSKKDSINLALVMNLKRSLADVSDEDLTIEVKKGVVYISLSDKMLFKSGSAVINTRAEEVLGKIAKVVNDHNELDILVEGHTDNVPIKNACIADNWDLSVKRATSVVRLLQEKYAVRPERMTAGGRSEFVPKASNVNMTGRSMNRRTEIIILPKLDQFFQLLEPPSVGN